jgi:hypothetical protein
MEKIEQAIVPITFLDEIDYNSENDKKAFMGDLNTLFVNPYNINTIYRPVTTVEPNDHIIQAYNDSIKQTKLAYIHMNVEDLVVNTIYELLSDIFEPRDNNSFRQVQCKIQKQFIDNLYIHRIIGDELLDIEFIDITLCNLYTKIVKDIIEPLCQVMTGDILGNRDICWSIYRRFVDDNKDNFDKVFNSFGNNLYCTMSSVIRDLAENKMSNIRRLFDVIKQSYLNMSQFSANYHIDPESKKVVSADDTYYNYLLQDMYEMEE